MPKTKMTSGISLPFKGKFYTIMHFAKSLAIAGSAILALTSGDEGISRTYGVCEKYASIFGAGVRMIVEFRITGKVQGVGFRWTAKRLADAAGLRGWVRNNRDGSVSLAASGDETRVQEFLHALDADMGRRIDAMTALDATPSGIGNGFFILC